MKVERMGLDLIMKEIKETKKSKWKKKIKSKIEEKIERDIKELSEVKSKLRFLKGKKFKKEEYLELRNTVQCSKIMQLRLNMVEVKMNYKNKCKEDMKWIGCKKEQESTEHMLRCSKYRELARHKLYLDEDARQIREMGCLMTEIIDIDRIQEK